jgi:hypothetical protein
LSSSSRWKDFFFLLIRFLNIFFLFYVCVNTGVISAAHHRAAEHRQDLSYFLLLFFFVGLRHRQDFLVIY